METPSSIFKLLEFDAHFVLFSLGPGQWRAYVCVEEPFERTNAGRAVVNRDAFNQILAAIRYAHMEAMRKNVRLGKLIGN